MNSYSNLEWLIQDSKILLAAGQKPTTGMDNSQHSNHSGFSDKAQRFERGKSMMKFKGKYIEKLQIH